MSKRISKIARSLKELGDIQVTDWDFEEFLHKDIRELEFAKSLRKLGSIQVMEWDFRDVLPAVSKLAQTEVDIGGFFRRAADYRVIEWDFRGNPLSETKSIAPPQEAPEAVKPEPGEIQALIIRLKNFLQYTVVQLIDEPAHAHIKVQQIAPDVLRFKLVMVSRDVSILIGTGGHTAAAIRGILKAVAATHGMKVLLRIHSHEEEIALGVEDPADE